MNKSTKAILKSGFFSGIIYAVGLAAFDYLLAEDFSIGRFIFHASFFGIFMAFMTNYNLKKSKQKKNNQEK